MIWKLPHPVLGVVLFCLVWAAGASLIGFGVAVPEMIGLTFLALGAFVLVNRRPARARKRNV